MYRKKKEKKRKSPVKGNPKLTTRRDRTSIQKNKTKLVVMKSLMDRHPQRSIIPNHLPNILSRSLHSFENLFVPLQPKPPQICKKKK